MFVVIESISKLGYVYSAEYNKIWKNDAKMTLVEVGMGKNSFLLISVT